VGNLTPGTEGKLMTRKKVGKKMPASAEARPTKAVRLELDADLHKRLRMAAAAADKSMAAYARDVIDRHLRGDKKK
jgi:predicted HicB family RNase H-like nuclease